MRFFIVVIVFSCIVFKSFQTNSQWDHFVFSLQWPQSVCNEQEEEGKGKCSLPAQTNFWTIHGLWPTFGTSEGPNFCRKSMKFNESLVDSIEDTLSINWPGLVPHESNTDFWKHEWEKHGTCAITMEELNTELKYFTQVLAIHKNLDITSKLSEKGFSPSDEKSYKYSDLKAALTEVIGKEPMMSCFTEKNGPLQYLIQLKICLDLNFNSIDCPHRSSENADYEEIKKNKLFSFLMENSKFNAQKNSPKHVIKMEIPDESIKDNRRKSGPEGAPCTDEKDIIYPIIRHA